MFCITYFKNILRRLNGEEPPRLLGRWNIDYCKNTLYQKVTMTNEDHCGSCGSTSIQKKIDKQLAIQSNRHKLADWSNKIKQK